ncbi:MAG: prepilin-type N-terminal cleavage/methylation domain-containing protein [Nitrospinota bacterium]
MVSVFRGNRGFSLVELMVAVLVLMIGTLGMLAVQITAIKSNKSTNLSMTASDFVHQEVEFVRNMGYVGLSSANLQTLQDSTGKTFTSYALLNSVYKNSAIDQTCNAPYTYCFYKGLDNTREAGGVTQTYRYTFKVMVNETYLSPYLKKVRLILYWDDGGKLKDMTMDFMVEAK